MFLLLLPLVTGAPWTLSDYVVMGVLFGAVGLMVEFAVRMSTDWRYRTGAALAVVTALLLVWVNLAVGLLGSEANPANLLFGGVLLVAVGASIGGGFRPAGMAMAMTVTGAAQVLVGAVAWAAGWASPGAGGVYEVVMGTTLFTGAWLAAAMLFRGAARRQARVDDFGWPAA